MAVAKWTSRSSCRWGPSDMSHVSLKRHTCLYFSASVTVSVLAPYPAAEHTTQYHSMQQGVELWVM